MNNTDFRRVRRKRRKLGSTERQATGSIAREETDRGRKGREGKGRKTGRALEERKERVERRIRRN